MAGIGVDRVYERRLAALVNSREQRLIARGRRGLERESLRVTPDGHIAQTPHPRSLGSALTNPHITTDYSEALIELVTPTFNDNEALLQYLGDLHQFVYAHLGRGAAVGHLDALHPGRRSGGADRALRRLVPGAGQIYLPARTAGALRRHDAGHFRRAFQLFGAGTVLAAVCRDLPVARQRPGIRLGALFRPAAQLPPPRLDRVVPVRRVAGAVPLVSAGPPGRATHAAGNRHPDRTGCDLAAHERHRLSQPQPGGRCRSTRSRSTCAICAARSASRTRHSPRWA